MIIRALSYGLFYEERIDYGDDWDCMPIGFHIAYRDIERRQSRTASYEYYMQRGDRKVIVSNPSTAEKIFARFMYFFRRKKRRLAGYRAECIRE